MGRAETGDTPPGGSKGAGDFLGVGRGGGGSEGLLCSQRERWESIRLSWLIFQDCASNLSRHLVSFNPVPTFFSPQG